MIKSCLCVVLVLLCILQVCPLSFHDRPTHDAEISGIDRDEVAFKEFERRFKKTYKNKNQEEGKKDNFK